MSLVLVTGCAHLANKELKQPTAEKTDSAFNTLLKKAEQGEAQAQYEIGFAYRQRNDFANAVKWYTKAADQGVGGAMLGLANRYAAGEFFRKR